MPDRVDTGVDPVQSSRPDPATNRLPSQPKPGKLNPAHDPVLPLGQVGDIGVNSVRPF